MPGLLDHITTHHPALANDIRLWSRWLDRINERRARNEPIGTAEMTAFKTHWRDTNRAITNTAFALRTNQRKDTHP